MRNINGEGMSLKAEADIDSVFGLEVRINKVSSENKSNKNDKFYEKGSDKSVSIEINELFGTSSSVKFRWIWLLPISFEISKPIRDKIYGFKCRKTTHSFLRYTVL